MWLKTSISGQVTTKVSSSETKERAEFTNVEQFLRSDPVLKPVFTMRNGGYQNEWEPGEKGVRVPQIQVLKPEVLNLGIKNLTWLDLNIKNSMETFYS
jgi:hypothetical protein